MTIRVLVVDDQSMVRAGFSALLDAQPGIEVVADASDGAAAVALAMQMHPDVVLMDVRMPGMDGIAATEEITRATAAHVLVLTTFDLDEYVLDALRAGAAGFLLKDATAAELTHGVRTVADGDALLAPAILKRLVVDLVGRPEAPSRDLDVLTPRERDVLVLVAAGLSNAEIADRLSLAEQTVKGHVSAMLQKLQLRDRAQAVVVAYESGLVTPGGGSPRALS
ncbi:response regulator transcription factor [Ruania alkalisoli]|uniref:Response regulator transcription factor n=1 Tax=Ruania alkalisoli TaxID=2779775 RepID=A0A7M1SST9_9MICO|nr:response regulator transcription factor [Ruania alkalisoli]QOR70620.1 response regulator transcription factor [Ruania alkalisoli]